MPDLPPSFLQMPIVHRGMHDVENGVQENSRPSFQAAIDHGFGIELDLQLSADGEAMVFHDYAMDRLTNEGGPIQMRTSKDLRATKLTVGGDNIMDLSELLELVDGRVPLLIELKDQDGAIGPNVGKLEQRVADLLADYDGDAVVMSFNPHSMVAMSKLAPEVPRGLTTCDFNAEFWPMLPRQRAKELATIGDFDRAGCNFISHDWRLLDAAPVLALKNRGVPILCWTIRSAEQEKIARKSADNITFEGYIPVTKQTSEGNDV